MLTRISDNYAVDIDKVLSIQILLSTNSLNINVQSDTGEIQRDVVSFLTYGEAKAALDALLDTSELKGEI